jgi:hypothetical protein
MALSWVCHIGFACYKKAVQKFIEDHRYDFGKGPQDDHDFSEEKNRIKQEYLDKVSGGGILLKRRRHAVAAVLLRYATQRPQCQPAPNIGSDSLPLPMKSAGDLWFSNGESPPCGRTFEFRRWCRVVWCLLT